MLSFIETIKEYFLTVAGESIYVGVPFLKDSGDLFPLEWNSVIGVSGKVGGVVYFSTEEKLLVDFYKNFVMPESEPSKQDLCDLMGEITNTIAGNMRSFYGGDFLVSVPITFVGKKMDIYIHIPRPLFVFPLKWRDFSAFFTVAIA